MPDRDRSADRNIKVTRTTHQRLVAIRDVMADELLHPVTLDDVIQTLLQVAVPHLGKVEKIPIVNGDGSPGVLTIYCA